MTKSNDLANKVGLFAIGLGIGSFLTIARTQLTLPFELIVGLVAISVAALFVGLFSLSPSEDYQANDEKDYATDKEMAVFIPDYSNKGTSYHQPHAKPFHFHMFLSPLRHIIGYVRGWLSTKVEKNH